MSEAQQQEPREQVDIPDGALVACPLVEFKLRQVSKCMGCAHLHRGALVRRMAPLPGQQIPFAAAFLVPCTARPVMREIKEAE